MQAKRCGLAFAEMYVLEKAMRTSIVVGAKNCTFRFDIASSEMEKFSIQVS